jgi:release factor glutamine methyltransferase
MTVREALREGADALSGTETAFLDASLLLAEVLGTSHSSLLASWPDEVGEAPLELYRARLGSRARGLPLAYILGRKEFWGRSFHVDDRVLIPRPDTETLVQAALDLGDAISRERAALRVHEACCGSGCVAISLAAERPDWILSASDLSEGALEVAAANAAALLAAGRSGGPLGLARGDLLSSLSPSGGRGGPPFDLILANPPYVPSAEARALLRQGWGEPLMALDGGPDGLDLVRRLVPQAVAALAPGGALLVEADGGQAAAVAALFGSAGLIGLGSLRDLGGRERVTSGRKAWIP